MSSIITSIVSLTKTAYYSTVTGLANIINVISQRGQSLTVSVPAVFPSDFSVNIASAMISMLNHNASAVTCPIQLALYNPNIMQTYTIRLGIGYISALAKLQPMYHNKQLNGQSWSFDFTDAMNQKYTITLDTDDLISLFSCIDFCHAGGSPGSLEGLVTVTYIPLGPQDQNNGEGNASPISPYDN